MQTIQNKTDELTATLKSADMSGARSKAGTSGTPKKGSAACPNNPNNLAHKFKGPAMSQAYLGRTATQTVLYLWGMES